MNKSFTEQYRNKQMHFFIFIKQFLTNNTTVINDKILMYGKRIMKDVYKLAKKLNGYYIDNGEKNGEIG